MNKAKESFTVICPEDQREAIAARVEAMVANMKKGLLEAAKEMNGKGEAFLRMYANLADGIRTSAVQVLIDPERLLARIVLPKTFIDGQQYLTIRVPGTIL